MDVDEIVPPADEMEQREKEMIQQLLARVAELEHMIGGGGRPQPDTKPAIMAADGGQVGKEPGRMMQ